MDGRKRSIHSIVICVFSLSHKRKSLHICFLPKGTSALFRLLVGLPRVAEKEIRDDKEDLTQKSST